MAPRRGRQRGGIAAVGPLGVTLASSSDAGLDISPNTGTAFASLHPSGQPLPRLYTVNLATGAATEVGTFPLDVVDLTILPTPPPTPGTGASSTGSAGGPTTTPTATATPSPAPLPPILNGAPLASLSLPKKARVAKVLQGRLKVGFTCDRACTAVASLVKGPTTAAAAAATRLATGRASLPAAGRGSITLRPTRAGKKALRRARARGTTLKATVSLAVTDAAGVKAAPLSRTLAIKR
jgi:hypothetical protein